MPRCCESRLRNCHDGCVGLARPSRLLPVLLTQMMPDLAQLAPGASLASKPNTRLQKKNHKYQVCLEGKGACSLKHFSALQFLLKKGTLFVRATKAFHRTTPTSLSLLSEFLVAVSKGSNYFVMLSKIPSELALVPSNWLLPPQALPYFF